VLIDAGRSVICRPEYTTKQLKCIALAAEHLSRLRCLQLEGGPTVVSIDVEAWERDGSKITEVGVAHLSGSGYILTRHFIIKEHEHLRNGIFVADNKYQFNSGGSEIISLEQVSSKLEGIYSSLHEPVTVGHSIHGDLKWLKGMGVYLDGRKAVDIALARQALDGKLESTSLVRMLEDLGIPYCNLHNAGNDARYTLQALIAMCASAGGCRIAPPTVRWGVWYVLQDHSWISRAN
jgi:DNA polymerase III epsilon subunit-like protein